MRKTLFFVTLLTLLVAACAVDPKISNWSDVYIDAWVKRNNPQVYVIPTSSPPMPYSALIVPFNISQEIYAPKALGAQLTKIVWQAWAADRVFPKLLYNDKLVDATPAAAIALGRKMGVNMVVTGTVTYLLAGGTRGSTAVSLELEGYDTATGERLFAMAHSGRIDTPMKEDYILFFRKYRLPQDPVYAIVSLLAQDMGATLTNWNYGYQPPEPDEEGEVAPPNPPSPPSPPDTQLNESYLPAG